MNLELADLVKPIFECASNQPRYNILGFTATILIGSRIFLDGSCQANLPLFN